MDREQLNAETGAVDADVAAPAAMAAVNLTLGFGAKTVLDQVNLQFPAGAVTSLLGPTGSGKTTFLRTLNRMNDKVSGYRYRGDVLLGGDSIFKNHDLMEFRRRVGMLFQRPNPFPMSIMEMWLPACALTRLCRARNSRALPRLDSLRLGSGMRLRIGSVIRRSGCPVVSSSCCVWPVRLR